METIKKPKLIVSLESIYEKAHTCGCDDHCVCDGQCDKKESWRPEEQEEIIKRAILKAQTRLKIAEELQKMELQK